MKTSKLGHRRRSRCLMCCCEDDTWCHPSARDEEKPRHVVWCSRCAMNIDRRTLCQQSKSTIPTSDVMLVDVYTVCRILIFARNLVQLGFSVTRRWNALYQPILALYALWEMYFDNVEAYEWHRSPPRT